MTNDPFPSRRQVIIELVEAAAALIVGGMAVIGGIIWLMK